MLIRSTSTRNIKPASVTTYCWKPSAVNTVNYANYILRNVSNRYMHFKYGASKYGATTAYSAGQKMPSLSTTEI